MAYIGRIYIRGVCVFMATVHSLFRQSGKSRYPLAASKAFVSVVVVVV